MTIKETIEEAKKVGVKDMSWKAWFMIVTIISAAAVASFYGVNVTMNIDLANRVGSLEGMLSHTINSTFYALQKQASYIISTVTSGATTYYCMQNGTTGKLDFWSTNASAITNAATGNGTYSNITVLLKAGTYLLQNDTVLGNNTVFRGENKYAVILVNARVGMAQGYTNGLIRNYGMGGALSLDQNITVSDLTIDGQRSAGKTGFGIAFEDVQYVTVRNVIVRDVDADGINFNGLSTNQGGRGAAVGNASNLAIENIDGSYNGVDCVAISNSTFVQINNVVSYKHGERTDINGHGLTLTQSEFVQVNNLRAYNATGSNTIGAIGLQLNGVRNSEFSNIDSSFNNGSGIYASDSGTYNCYRNTFVNIHVNYNMFRGMYLNNLDGSTFSNIEAISNSQFANDTYAGVYWVATQDVVFSNARLGDVQTSKTQTVGMNETGTSDRNIFALINARDNWQAGILTVGANTKVNLCWNSTSWIA